MSSAKPRVRTAYVILHLLSQRSEIREDHLVQETRRILEAHGLKPTFRSSSFTVEGFVINHLGRHIDIRHTLSYEHDDGEPRRHGPCLERFYRVYTGSATAYRLERLEQKHEFLRDLKLSGSPV